MKTKICTKCKKEKSFDKFPKCNQHSDGKSSWCKICKCKAYKKYSLKNKDKIALTKKIYNLKNRLKIKLYQMKYKKINKDKIKMSNQKYNKIHKEKRKKYNRNYLFEHKEERKRYVNNYQKNKRKTNLNFRMKKNLQSRISIGIKHNTKSLSTMFLIGCEIDYLLFHLQSQFTEGMNWNNYGTGRNGKGMKEWHIDHIRPCASFDLSKPKKQCKCFNYTNLQPLWAKDNLTKSMKTER